SGASLATLSRLISVSAEYLVAPGSPPYTGQFTDADCARLTVANRESNATAATLFIPLRFLGPPEATRRRMSVSRSRSFPRHTSERRLRTDSRDRAPAPMNRRRSSTDPRPSGTHPQDDPESCPPTSAAPGHRPHEPDPGTHRGSSPPFEHAA